MREHIVPCKPAKALGVQALFPHKAVQRGIGVHFGKRRAEKSVFLKKAGKRLKKPERRRESLNQKGKLPLIAQTVVVKLV